MQQKFLLPEDRDLPSNVVLKEDQLRRERVASYREMQALSHTIRHLTKSGIESIDPEADLQNDTGATMSNSCMRMYRHAGPNGVDLRPLCQSSQH